MGRYICKWRKWLESAKLTQVWKQYVTGRDMKNGLWYPSRRQLGAKDRKAKENIYHLSKFLFCFEFIHKQDVNWTRWFGSLPDGEGRRKVVRWRGDKIRWGGDETRWRGDETRKDGKGLRGLRSSLPWTQLWGCQLRKLQGLLSQECFSVAGGENHCTGIINVRTDVKTGVLLCVPRCVSDWQSYQKVIERFSAIYL